MGTIFAFMGGPLLGFLKAFWKPIAIIVAVLVVVAAIHHRGYSSGVAKTEKKYTIIVTKANAERDSARAALIKIEAAYEILKKEDDRIKAQQITAAKAAVITDKQTAERVKAIRARVGKGATQAERLRSLMEQQAQP